MTDASSGVAIGKRLTEEGVKGTAGAALGVGGLVAVKGATEAQDRMVKRVRVHEAKAGFHQGAASTLRAQRGPALKVRNEGKIAGPSQDRAFRERTARSHDAHAQRASRTAARVAQLQRPAFKRAQRTKLGGLAAMGVGAGLGVSAVRGVGRRRRMSDPTYGDWS